MSLRKEGASKGATVSFLIATPETGVDSILATYSLLGLPFAVIRPIAACCNALLGGMMVNKLGDPHTTPAEEKSEEEEETTSCCCHHHHHEHHEHDHHEHHSPLNVQCSMFNKFKEALKFGFVEMMEDIGKWLVIGLVIAGLITVFVPAELFAVFNGNTLASMLLVLCIALPMYLCATGSIPIAVALMMKGLTPGAALVLLMAGPACNFASMLVVKKVLGTRTLVTYLASIIVGSIAFGYLIDYLQFNGIVNFLEQLTMQQACCEEGDSWFSWVCTILMALMLINAIVLPKLGLRKAHQCHCHGEHNHGGDCSCGCDDDDCCDTKEHAEARTYIIEGMNCNHCRGNAEKALQQVEGVTSASVDLVSKRAVVVGTATEAQLREAIESIGFRLEKA
jgi:uncharacterized membrane protein YraQ (UPF0718 family)/copper chaperone CopZ